VSTGTPIKRHASRGFLLQHNPLTAGISDTVRHPVQAFHLLPLKYTNRSYRKPPVLYNIAVYRRYAAGDYPAVMNRQPRRKQGH